MLTRHLFKIILIIFCIFRPYSITAQPNLSVEDPLNITVIGTGYVGLVLGIGLAEIGHRVICMDNDQRKIQLLTEGKSPIYEPGLSELLQKNVAKKSLEFTSDLAYATKCSDVIFIAVCTPSKENGEADLSYIENVVEQLMLHVKRETVVSIKSTVPIGTTEKIRDLFLDKSLRTSPIDVVFNPEFFREGCALNDFFYPDRIICGCETQRAKSVMSQVYAPFSQNNVPFLYCNYASAETIKYASNAFLAVKISYINELAHFCEAYGADIHAVSKGMGLDPRIGQEFLKPGPGYGGSCLPKDTLALLSIAHQKDIPLSIVEATVTANERHKQSILKKLLKYFPNGNLNKVALLGLSFKANTDDIRCAPFCTLLPELLKLDVKITAYDPIATENAKKLYPEITYTKTAYDAVESADAVLLLTDWEEFKSLDLPLIKSLMNNNVFIDARNVFSNTEMTLQNFRYSGFGQGESTYEHQDAIN